MCVAATSTINMITLHVVVMYNLTFFVRFGKPQRRTTTTRGKGGYRTKGGGSQKCSSGKGGMGKGEGETMADGRECGVTSVWMSRSDIQVKTL